MKKIIIVAILLMGIASMSSKTMAQGHAFPRYGTASNQDQTFRNQKISYFAKTDAAQTAIDTITIFPTGLINHVKLTVNDSVAIFTNPAQSYAGDELIVMIANTTGANHIVRFVGKGAVGIPFQFGSSGSSIALTSAKNAVITFSFDGVNWMERSRVVQ